MGIKITWHGHGTLSLQIDGINVVVDPFFAGHNPVAVKHVNEVEADFILQTHGHSDHIADTVALGKRTGAQVIAMVEVAKWIAAQGHDNTWGMNLGGSHQFPFGTVKMTPALHSSGLPDGSYGGFPAGFLVKAEAGTVYVAGDTDLFSDMSFIGAAGIDVAILPTGSNFTMGPEEALQALSFLEPRVVIPYHYNTWPPIRQDMHAWARRVQQETSTSPVVLEVEGCYEF
ncbi:MAG: metal-dependent hydrolase [Candidatus Promineifilaceae bacterium]